MADLSTAEVYHESNFTLSNCIGVISVMQTATLLRSLFIVVFTISCFALASVGFAQDDRNGNAATIQDIDEPSVESGVNFFLDLAQNQKVEGVAVDVEKFKITTGFGDVQVPLDKIDGIRLNAMEDGSAVMAFKNGDILTGVLHVSDLKLRTSWGFATVNIAYISQISTTKGASFSSSKVNGKTTWSFTRGIEN